MLDRVNKYLKTTIKKHNEKYGHEEFCYTTMKGDIQFIDPINNKTKKITLSGGNLMHEARRTIVATERNYKINKLNNMSIIIGNKTENYVVSTYLKMQISTMWRNILKKSAENRDYLYNHCEIDFIDIIDIVLIGICITLSKKTQ